MATHPASDHGALMDSVYRGQRHIYDATRKFYLFGRDRLIGQLDCRPGDGVLELGCGTGRNLRAIGRRWPDVALHGIDISSEMLKSARATLGDRATLSLGDATAFDAGILFGRDGFEHVVLSYALSMIPDWRAALEQGLLAVSPGGRLHAVDFGGFAGLPAPLRAALRAWLAHFHVTPRIELVACARELAARHGCACKVERGPLGYFQRIEISRSAA